jgi:uncharacterized protein (DUF2141 family)
MTKQLLVGYIALILLLTTCARVITPNGGAKDTSPPRAVKYMPDSAAIQVSGKRIVIRFNEYIVLNGITEQLLVSPPLTIPPEVTIRSKDLVIDIRDTLRPNTTYTVSFGNAIRDITENNIADNFKYVFSTGSTIDSLHIQGRVTNAATLNPEKAVLVFLYATNADSAPYLLRPYYFAKTLEDGSFEINNLRAGNYKVVAVKDRNGNYQYDGLEEQIAFRDSMLTVDRHRDSIQLYLFQENESKKQIRQVTQSIPGKISLALTQCIQKLSVAIEPSFSDTVKLFQEYNQRGDTLILWLNKNSGDSVSLIVKDGEQPFDTARIQLVDPKVKRILSRGGQEDTRALLIAASVQPAQRADLYQPLHIRASIPIDTFHLSGIILLKGKDTLRLQPRVDSINRHILELPVVFQEDSSYTLIVKPGSITDWFGQKSKDTLLIPFTVRNTEDYGNLNFSLPGLREGDYLLQLFDEKGKKIEERIIRNGDMQVFNHLLPGQYGVHLITDRNANQMYDTGSYLEHRQPEKIRIYGGAIRVRAGWDTDVEWKFKK